MNTSTQMELVDINKLIPYVNNARTHSKDQITKLRSSLREFGFINPVIIDKDYNVLAGMVVLWRPKKRRCQMFHVYLWNI